MTKATVEMCALDLRPFTEIAGDGFRGLLIVCTDIAQNVQGKIDIQDLLPHPTTISQNLDVYADKVRQALKGAIQYILEEFLCTVFTTDMTTEYYTKTSYSALTSHYINQ